MPTCSVTLKCGVAKAYVFVMETINNTKTKEKRKKKIENRAYAVGKGGEEMKK